MKLKDISNKDVASIENCESEPIHIPGAIQPYGVLIAIDLEGAIKFCSANCADAFGRSPETLLQKSLLDVVPALHDCLKPLLEDEEAEMAPFLSKHGDSDWQAFCSRSDDLVLIELERHTGTEASNEDLFDQTRRFVNLIERTKSLQDLCQKIAEETRSITGYDRVMIYKFDADFNGRVYAESKAPGVDPYLDLHYPHTDIPAQARELYLRNHMRMIASVDYAPVPLSTVENSGYSSLDLSGSVLRSVSPIHIQYLKNMGVKATLTISLIHEGKLWGLIACHHYKEKLLGYGQRKAAQMQGHFLTSQIKVRQVAEEYEVHTLVEAHLQQLLNAIPQDGDFTLKFAGFTSLLSLTNASGAVILHKGRLYEKGIVPSSDKIKALLNWLSEHVTGLQFSTSHLREHYPEGEKICRQASGIIYHKLGDAKKDAIIWFREEMERTINWAGDPHDAVRKTVHNELTPRTSFAIYKQSIRFHSQEWQSPELNAAQRFASALLNQFHLDYLRSEEAQQRLLNEKLTKANQELANINWITTHDLKEPLRKILVFSSKVLSAEEKQLSEGITASINRIQESAFRMRTLVDDIVTYTMTEGSKTTVEADLNEIVREVAADFATELAENNIRLTIEKLPVISAIPYQMRQLFVNLIDNSIKFSRKQISGQINFSCSKVQDPSAVSSLLDAARHYYRIEVADNGLGFDQSHAEKIFDIFYRSHPRNVAEGTGIGLAICKRIVENHQGLIQAKGESGVGASLIIYLPE